MKLRKIRLSNRRRGYAFILDSLMALVVALVAISILYAISFPKVSKVSRTTFVNLHYLSEDVLDTLNKKGIIDQLGEGWVRNDTNETATVADHYLERMLPQNVGYRLTIDDELITEGTGRIGESLADSKTHANRYLIGYGRENVTNGMVARAYLNSTVKVPYGDVYERNTSESGDGCRWHFRFENGTNVTMPIPSSYNASENCNYSYSSPVMNTNDAIDDAAYRLLRELDSDANDRVTEFNVTSFRINSMMVGGIRSLWGPIEVKLILWM